MIYRNRLHFAAILRKARAEGTLTSYDKQGQWRNATVNWSWRIYEPAYQSMLNDERGKGDDDGAEYADPRDYMDEVRRG